MLKKEKKIIPSPPPFRKLLGPSFILLGLGLGSGEIILWPYLVSNYGLGIAWGAVLGLTFQYFINLEIERYTLAKGESIFVGLSRRFKTVPYWLIASTLIGFGWPGIILSSAILFSSVFGGDSTYIAVGLLILIGILLSSGRYIYNTVERFSLLIIGIGVPAVILLTLWFVREKHVIDLLQGVIGSGDNFWFLPAGISFSVFLGALAFSGAGGNLNLTQSSYIREKGYGMGSFATKIKGLFAGRSQKIDLNGYHFHPTEENIRRFHAWWHVVKKEHFIVFYGMGMITVLMLMMLSYATVYGLPGNVSGINFVLNEAKVIGLTTLPIVGLIFAGVLGVMLFSTQFSVFDSTSRIMSENMAVIISRHKKPVNLSRYYYIFLWLQILFGIGVFLSGMREPLKLLVLAANINAVCMFVHIGLVNRLNYKELPKEIQPAVARRVIVILAFLFFGFFSAFTFAMNLWK